MVPSTEIHRSVDRKFFFKYVDMDKSEAVYKDRGGSVDSGLVNRNRVDLLTAAMTGINCHPEGDQFTEMGIISWQAQSFGS